MELLLRDAVAFQQAVGDQGSCPSLFRHPEIQPVDNRHVHHVLIGDFLQHGLIAFLPYQLNHKGRLHLFIVPIVLRTYHWPVPIALLRLFRNLTNHFLIGSPVLNCGKIAFHAHGNPHAPIFRPYSNAVIGCVLQLLHMAVLHRSPLQISGQPPRQIPFDLFDKFLVIHLYALLVFHSVHYSAFPSDQSSFTSPLLPPRSIHLLSHVIFPRRIISGSKKAAVQSVRNAAS